jgi:hypothetical protein
VCYKLLENEILEKVHECSAIGVHNQKSAGTNKNDLSTGGKRSKTYKEVYEKPF